MNNSNSTNFQPLTQNPQNGAIANLQRGGAELQPITNTNQPGNLNPQVLPMTNSLRVLSLNKSTTGQIVQPRNNAAPNVPPPGSSGSLWLFSIGTFIVAVILLVIAKTAKPASEAATVKTSNVLKDKTVTPLAEAKPLSKNKFKKKNKKNKR